MNNPEKYYTEALSDVTDKNKQLRNAIEKFSDLRLALGLFIAVGVAAALYTGYKPAWIMVSLIVVAFIIAVIRQSVLIRKSELTAISIHIFQNELNVLGGDFSGNKTGIEYMDISHPYTLDMDVFGKDSLYQMIARTVTLRGDKLLASLLKHPYAGVDAIKQRQAAIKELSADAGLLHLFQLQGRRYKEGDDDRQNVLQWMQLPTALVQHKFLRVFYILSLIVTIPVLAGCLFFDLPRGALLFAMMMNWIILYRFAKPMKKIKKLVANSIAFIDKYEALFKLVAERKFVADGLSSIASKAHQSALAITRLRTLAKILENNQHGMVKPVMNTLFLFDVYCCMKLERWKQEHHLRIEEAISALEELDVHVSLAIYAFNNPGNNYAEISDEQLEAELLDVKHPLITNTQLVGNDLRLGNPERFYLLTGANMTGKSTYIRTIGTSILLSYTGVPIKAKKAKMPVLHLYTSMRITDSLQDDRSYFMAELTRMQTIMQQTATGQPALILIDEPLKGTNSLDKRDGTVAIIQRLLERNTVGIIATHDTQLCDLESSHAPLVVNRHFDSEVIDDELVFDYLLKEGCSQSNNATMLMRKMGIV